MTAAEFVELLMLPHEMDLHVEHAISRLSVNLRLRVTRREAAEALPRHAERVRELRENIEPILARLDAAGVDTGPCRAEAPGKKYASGPLASALAVASEGIDGLELIAAACGKIREAMKNGDADTVRGAGFAVSEILRRRPGMLGYGQQDTMRMFERIARCAAFDTVSPEVAEILAGVESELAASAAAEVDEYMDGDDVPVL